MNRHASNQTQSLIYCITLGSGKARAANSTLYIFAECNMLNAGRCAHARTHTCLDARDGRRGKKKIHAYIHTCIHTYIHTYRRRRSVSMHLCVCRCVGKIYEEAMHLPLHTSLGCRCLSHWLLSCGVSLLWDRGLDASHLGYEPNIEALTIRIGFWGRLSHNCNKGSPK